MADLSMVPIKGAVSALKEHTAPRAEPLVLVQSHACLSVLAHYY